MTGPGLRFAARGLPLEALTPALEDEWLALAGRSIEGNCFLAPWFIKPAARWLDPGLPLRLLLVEAFDSGQRLGLSALMAVRGVPAARSLPIAHLAAYRPLHAYSSGALVDARFATPSLQALLTALPDLLPEGGALRLANFRCDGDLGGAAAPLLEGAGLRWFVTRDGRRAALRLEGEGPLPPVARKPMRRALERLESLAGPVRFRALRDAEVDVAAVERHLALEHAGWKGPAGGSLLAQAGHAEFFRDVVRGAASASSLLFCELLAGDRVVASTSNFLAGREAFAFKLGWDPQLARGSPGRLVDDALRCHAPTVLSGARTLDGCADPGSHLDQIWDDRLRVIDGYLAWGRRECAVLAAFAAARRWRDGARAVAGPWMRRAP
jgi:CelD/BcsL family acetyltransferase involved in cellulose biosynthesis